MGGDIVLVSRVSPPSTSACGESHAMQEQNGSLVAEDMVYFCILLSGYSGLMKQLTLVIIPGKTFIIGERTTVPVVWKMARGTNKDERLELIPE